MIFGDLESVNLPDIRLKGEENPEKTSPRKVFPAGGSNPGPLHDRRACYRVLHSGGLP